MPSLVDPLANYCFAIEIHGMAIAQFKEISGIGMSIGVIENRQNQLKQQPVLQKLPGTVKYDDIHLSRGKVSDKEFWNWIKQVKDGQISQARKDGSIILLDFDFTSEIHRINFFGAWPTRVEIGKMTAGGEAVLLETVVLAVERIEVA
jgi:phage tail-like protein